MELSVAEVSRRIYLVRGYQVVLDNDLAEFYQSETRLLNRSVKRNRDRFPPDFMFKLTVEENNTLKSQTLFVKSKHGGRRHIPHAFTEHGVSMLSSVLGNKQAVQVNIEIMRIFAQTRQVSLAELDSTKRLNKIENKLESVEQGIQQLLAAKPINYFPASEKTDRTAFNSGEPVRFIEDSPLGGIEVENLILGKELCLKVETIHQAVANFFGLSVQELKAVSRSRKVVLPRQIAIFLVRKHTECSFKEIGKGLNLKDHTTAMHAYRKISAAVERCDSIKKAISLIQSSLNRSDDFDSSTT